MILQKATKAAKKRSDMRELRTKTPVPVWRLLQDLVDADSECFIFIAFLYEVFINPKLCCCDGFSLWDTREIESKYSSVPLMHTILVLINYKKYRKIREITDLFRCAKSISIRL